MLSRWTILAIGFLSLLSGVLGAVGIVLSFPELPLSSCTDVGYASGNAPPRVFEYYEFYWGWLGYSPDGGVNRCDTPIVTIVVGLLGIGSALLGIARRNR